MGLNLDHFHGIWYSEYISFLNGYCTKDSVTLEDIDNYVAIDTRSRAPLVRIGSTHGTLWHLHSREFHWADSTYQAIDPDTLVSSDFAQQDVYNSIVELFHPILKYLGAPLSRPNSPPAIMVTSDYGVAHGIPSRYSSYVLLTGGPQLLRRLSSDIATRWKPEFLVPYTLADAFGNVHGSDDTRVRDLFTYVFHRLFSFINTNTRENRDVFTSFAETQQLMREYCRGRRIQTPIVRIWASKNGSRVTEVFLRSFPYAPVGSTIRLDGLQGEWSLYNGKRLKNAVGLLHFADTPRPSANHLYLPLRWPKVVLNLDTRRLRNFENSRNSRNPNGAELEPTLTVEHRIHSNMQYCEFVSALMALQYEVFGMSQHTAYGVWVYKDRPFIPETWEELRRAYHQEALGAGINRWRSNRVTPTQFYHNPIVQCDSGVNGSGMQALMNPTTLPYCHLNDPVIPISDLAPGGHLDYNIVQSNYLRNRVFHLYWRIVGPARFPFQSQLVQMGYRQNGSEFEGRASTRDLGPQWDIMGVTAASQDDHTAAAPQRQDINLQKMKDRLYVGHLQSNSGRPVGYMRISSFDFSDPLLLMFDIRMGAERAHYETSRRLGSENFCGLFANLMRAMLKPQVHDVIIDLRSNTGGLAHAPLIASFFGGNRAGSDGNFAIRNPHSPNQVGRGAPESILWTDVLKEYGAESHRGILEAADEMMKVIDVDETIKRYGQECVFQNGNLYILTDECSCSEGDEFVHYFLGDRLNRDIGGGVRVFLVGEMSGRIIGGTFCNLTEYGLPWRPNESKTDIPNPIPISRIENSAAGIVKINGRPLSVQTKATKLDILIPNVAEIVWQDLGLVQGSFKTLNRPNIRYEDRSTWRDFQIDTILHHVG